MGRREALIPGESMVFVFVSADALRDGYVAIGACFYIIQ
jgi:hypothetical protein